MQAQVTLSKKEKRYQFFYLILMLLLALVFLGIIFLHRYKSPFSEADINTLQILEQKSKFNQQQKVGLKNIDSAFAKLKRISPEDFSKVESNYVQFAISDVANTFQNYPVHDDRKNAYPKIALFFKMYLDDKERIMNIKKNTKYFEKLAEECEMGYKQKSQNLRDRNNALSSR